MHAVDVAMQTDGGASVQRFQLRLRDLVVESDCYGQDQCIGNENYEETIEVQKERKMRRPWQGTVQERREWQGLSGKDEATLPA